MKYQINKKDIYFKHVIHIVLLFLVINTKAGADLWFKTETPSFDRPIFESSLSTPGAARNPISNFVAELNHIVSRYFMFVVLVIGVR